MQATMQATQAAGTTTGGASGWSVRNSTVGLTTGELSWSQKPPVVSGGVRARAHGHAYVYAHARVCLVHGFHSTSKQIGS